MKTVLESKKSILQNNGSSQKLGQSGITGLLEEDSNILIFEIDLS
ncbi:hypothetical protein ACO1KB_09860 [Leptospira interrogans serovar Szwajizak]